MSFIDCYFKRVKKETIIKTREASPPIVTNNFELWNDNGSSQTIKQEDILVKIEHDDAAHDLNIAEMLRPVSHTSNTNKIVESNLTNSRFRCKSCNSVCSSHSSLRTRTSSGQQQKPQQSNFYCISCLLTRSAKISHVDQQNNDSKESFKELPNTTNEPDCDDPNFYCRSCDKKYLNRAAYRSHLRTQHDDFYKGKHQPKLSIEPDLYDPNFYCRSCDLKYANRASYRDHLNRKHRNVYKSSPKLQPNPSIKPDLHDPNFYCRSCNAKYLCRYSYQRHLRTKHSDIFTNLVIKKTQRNSITAAAKKTQPNPSIEQPDFYDPNFYCKSCDLKYANRASYLDHLRRKHRHNVYKGNHHPNPNIEPDIHDPNFHCRTCDFKYRNRASYLKHLNRKHSQFYNSYKKNQPKPNIKPDLQDPEFHCESCDSKYSIRHSYLDHLRRKHRKIYKGSPKHQSNPNIKPDLYDPNFYCQSCDAKYANRRSFRYHLRTKHSDIYTSPAIKKAQLNSSTEPDLYDPNFYCRSCDLKYLNRHSYRNHLRIKHSELLYSTTTAPKIISHPFSHSTKLDSNEKQPFHCQVCDSNYLTLGIFRRHLRDSHR